MNSLGVIGLNHRSASVELREKLAFKPTELPALLERLLALEGVNEAAILCTCNRTELIICGSPEGRSALLDFLQEAGDLPQEQADGAFYSLAGEEALLHLLRLGSGLDSLVLGETQILGQLKAAFETSFESGAAGPVLGRAYQRIVKCARAVRRDTSIGRGVVSVASVAVQLARNIFESLHDKRVLLVGAGEMCELAARHFQEAGIAEILVANRTVERARDLAAIFQGRAFPLDQLAAAAAQVDVILCSTGAPGYVLSPELIRSVMPGRSHPLFLIDIAVPRDIDPACNSIAQVFLYDIDDLGRIAEENRLQREQALQEAQAIVNAMLREHQEEELVSGIGPLILSLQQRAQSIKEEELARLFRRLNTDLDDKARLQITQSMTLIINKILHDPILSLREGVRRDRSSRWAAVFKEFFNI